MDRLQPWDCQIMLLGFCSNRYVRFDEGLFTISPRFLAYRVLDIWAAFILGQTTLISTETWVEDDVVESVATTGNLDDYCNLSILMFAKVINLLAPARKYPPSPAEVRTLWDQLQLWRDMRPLGALPLIASTEPDEPFSAVIYAASSSSKFKKQSGIST